MKRPIEVKKLFFDVLIAVTAGIIVGVAYFFFQNSNGFAPGGVGGLATMTHHYIIAMGGTLDWGILMVAFNLPIFLLVTILIDKKLGLILTVYLAVQSSMPALLSAIGFQPYCLAVNGEDFNIVFACIATGVVSGAGFSMMLRRFGASGGTYGISALIKKYRPALNIAYVSFFMDAGVVAVAFFVYGMKVTPVICTLINLFIANIIVDSGVSGIKNGYRFEIITDEPEKLAEELMTKLKHGVTEVRALGMYRHTDRYVIICIINKRQIGDMMRIIKTYPNTFASFSKVNEVLGNFKRKI